MNPSTWVRVVLLGIVLCLLAGGATVEAALGGSIQVRPSGEGEQVAYISPDGWETLIGVARGAVSGERLVTVPAANVQYAAWDEAAQGGPEHRVSVSLDGGFTWSRPRAMTYEIPLRAGRLDPGVAVPALPELLRAQPSDRLYIVQFETTGLNAWRKTLVDLGAEVLAYLPQQAHIVRMDPGLLPEVAAQPFVRWVGPYEPGYRIEPEVLAEIAAADFCGGPARRYNLLTFTPGPGEKRVLANEILGLGGVVEREIPSGYRLEATLTFDQVTRLARSTHLLWIDRWSAPETDMDIVREQSGSNYVESVGGYSGQGVAGEVMDCGIMGAHQDHDGKQIHGPAAASCDHGTCTYGIVFGNGNRDGDGDAKALGHLPSAQGWFFDYNNLTDRYRETAELVESPIFASFQSNSWGDARTRSYNSISFEMDDIIYIYDIPIFQSQSNAGNQDSRPQAWSKNIISIGAVNHYDTPSLADDCWCSGASIGPAEDGRIKPDLAYWYDSIYTTDLEPGGYSTGLYTPGFGGTSAATPITAGIGGLILQMWADNLLGNNPTGTTVFEKRPHSTTTKALMINTAEQYPFSGTTSDLTRMHQGWGLPSARRFYDRAPLLKVVDETHVLQELDVHVWTAVVPAGQQELKVTLVYMDRAGTTSSTLHRINDVTIKVVDPTGSTTYWGNNGLEAGNWSAPGGSADSKNTVENVFVQNPAAGSWTIEVSADDLNQDAHAETPEVDQDYALVVYGANALDFGCAVPPPAPAGLSAQNGGDNRVDLNWEGTPSARGYKVYRATGGCGGTFTPIGQLPSTQTTFNDTTASGGLTYGYVVKSLESCESPASNCAEILATGPCILPPSFAGLDAVTGNNATTCGTTLTWTASLPSCGGPAVYSVYRSTTPNVVPTASNRVASCVTGTSWVDTRNLSSNRTYHYLVRAEDLGGRGSAVCGGAAESNAVVKSALVQGPSGSLLVSAFENGLEGWTPGWGSPPATAGDFLAGSPTGSSFSGQPAQPSSCAQGSQCLFTEANKGGNAKNGDVDGGEVLATSPTFDASGFATARLTLSRWHFNGATMSDSGDRFALDVSNDDGSTWANLETLGALQSVNAWTPVGFNLETVRALTSQMKVRVRSADGTLVDTIVESAIDDVRVLGAQICSGIVPEAPGDTAPGSLRIDKEGSNLRLRWGADCGGGNGYGLYRGDLFAGYDSIAPVPGFCGVGATSAVLDPGPESYFFLVTPNDGAWEGSLGRRSDGSPRPHPSAACWPRSAAVNACAE